MTESDLSRSRIGKRIANYRKLKFTAAELADRIPNPKITASVIQNIESGRKKDLTISQLLDIAMGIGVSPLVLLVPVGNPFQKIDLDGVGAEVAALTVHEFDKWMTIPEKEPELEPSDQATLRRIVNYTRRLIEAVEDWKTAASSPDLNAEPFEYEARNGDTEADIYTAIHDPSEGAWMHLNAAVHDVKRFSTFLSQYNVDLSWVPDVDSSEK